MSVSDQQQQPNWLLTALPDDDRERLLQHGEHVSLSRGQRVVMNAHEPSPAIYFGLTAVVSVVQTSADGAMSEIATVGRDGMVPLHTFLTGRTSPWDAFCQIPGDAVRMPADTLGTIVTGTPGVRKILGLYSQAVIEQIGRNAACNQLHSMSQRCSRWILLIRRQCGRDDFPLTQQSLATMLGVRRATVTAAAQDLQTAGAITYRHGSMHVTDAETLLERSCHCYRAIADRYEQLLRN